MSIFFIPSYTKLAIAKEYVANPCFAMECIILNYPTFKSINFLGLICRHLRQSTVNFSIIIIVNMLVVDSSIQMEIEGVILRPSIILI